MAHISSSFLFETHLEGGRVNLFIPKLGTRFYHVQFRIRDMNRQSGWRQVLRSCGTSDYADAKVRAAEIFIEEAARGKKNPEVSLQQATAKVDTPPVVTDPGIDEVIAHHKVWMASVIPGEKRPSLSTARTYHQRLQQLCRLLEVETVGQLAQAVKGLTPTQLGVSEENFVPLMRGAAGVFRRKCMAYYAEQGVRFDTPLNSGPTVRVNEFMTPPSAEQLERLKEAARNELKPGSPREYLAFTLLLNAGLRAQEAAHVRWMDVGPTGIRVSSDAGRCQALPERERYAPKTRKDRIVPVDPAILEELDVYRRSPPDYVLPLTKAQRHEGYVPRLRVQVIYRNLAQWLRRKLPESLSEVKNPNHWLRKVFGSVVALEADIPTAGDYLGHAKGSPVTAQTYVALLRRPAFRIGMALEPLRHLGSEARRG